MPTTKPRADKAEEHVPYSERDDWEPNPLHQTGVVDTTGVTGDIGSRIENISPIFAKAKADAFQNAVDAIDDPDRNEDEVVVFHDGEDGQQSREDAEASLREAAEDAASNPQLSDPSQTPAAVAAEKSGEEGSDAASDSPGRYETHDTDEASRKADALDEDAEERPKDSDSKTKWSEYADSFDPPLDVDKALLKEEYIAEVKKAADAR